MTDPVDLPVGATGADARRLDHALAVWAATPVPVAGEARMLAAVDAAIMPRGRRAWPFAAAALAAGLATLAVWRVPAPVPVPVTASAAAIATRDGDSLAFRSLFTPTPDEDEIL